MGMLTRVVALFLCFALVVFAEGNTFDRVRYNGGSVNSKVDPHDWHNMLVVTSDLITLALKDGTKVDIAPKAVTSLSYGQEAHRRVGTMVALAILVAPIALFGLFAKTRLHFIGIQYTTPDKKSAGILLQGDKDNYRAMLVALQGVTGVPVSVAEKEREFVPVGVRTQVTNTEVTETAQTPQPATTTSAATKNAQNTSSSPPRAEVIQASDHNSEAQPSPALCIVTINSNPTGADIFVDDELAGNTPSTLNMSIGKHSLAVKKQGFQEWVRKVNLYGGSINLSAELIRGTEETHAATGAMAVGGKESANAAASSQQSVGWIGIHAQNSGDVAVVTNVSADGPGAKAGIQVGDVILALDGRLIKGKDFETAVAALKPGTQISVNYARGSSTHEVQMTVGSHNM